MKRGIGRAHQVAEFLMDDPDDLLVGSERLENLFANGLFGTALDKTRGHVVMHVGFEERFANLRQAVANVGLGEFPTASQH